MLTLALWLPRKRLPGRSLPLAPEQSRRPLGCTALQEPLTPGCSRAPGAGCVSHFKTGVLDPSFLL